MHEELNPGVSISPTDARQFIPRYAKKYYKEEPGNTKPKKLNNYFMDGIIDYIANSVAITTILEKPTARISLMAFDSGQELKEKTSAFETFFHIIEGKAEIVIDRVSHFLESGEGIIIPAHSPNLIRANGRFKMILTSIKNNPDQVSLSAE